MIPMSESESKGGPVVGLLLAILALVIMLMV
jgi:hypothetical protein